jgi:hypothetical protein
MINYIVASALFVTLLPLFFKKKYIYKTHSTHIHMIRIYKKLCQEMVTKVKLLKINGV